MNDSAGAALYDELLWVHGMIRRDLDTVRELAGAVTNGAPAREVQDSLGELKTNGPLWKLKVNCLHYCRFVHSHHGAEDRMLFPALRAANPDLAPVVDRLETDHREVAVLLDAVEEAARSLSAEAEAESRERVAGALNALADHLLEHLAFEEESVADTMRAMTAL
jgi:Hemerythrin HHE cation binding domain